MNLEELSKLKYESAGFNSVLEFVSQIKNAKVSNDMDNIYTTVLSISDLREDKVAPSLPIDKVLFNAAKHDKKYFIVPQTVE